MARLSLMIPTLRVSQISVSTSFTSELNDFLVSKSNLMSSLSSGPSSTAV